MHKNNNNSAGIVKPYVYVITHPQLGYWYIGSRQANTVPAHLDVGYWGSSDELKKLMFENPDNATEGFAWIKQVLQVCDNEAEVGRVEKEFLTECWDYPGRINKSKLGAGISKSAQDKKVRVALYQEKRALRKLAKAQIAVDSYEIEKSKIWNDNASNYDNGFEKAI